MPKSENKKRYVRQCPHCKSKKGYRLSYVIHGNGYEDLTYKGKVLDAERNEFDDTDRTVECLECGKFFDTELVEQR